MEYIAEIRVDLDGYPGSEKLVMKQGDFRQVCSCNFNEKWRSGGGRRGSDSADSNGEAGWYTGARG